MTNQSIIPARSKPGPKPKRVDWRAIGEAAKIYCTHEELAAISGVCLETLQAACQREMQIEFSEWVGQKRAVGRESLRRAQWKKAMSGNVVMMIWLGKQWLGQMDKPETASSDGAPAVFNIITNIPGFGNARKPNEVHRPQEDIWTQIPDRD